MDEGQLHALGIYREGKERAEIDINPLEAVELLLLYVPRQTKKASLERERRNK